jgi:hypothetical protein
MMPPFVRPGSTNGTVGKDVALDDELGCADGVPLTRLEAEPDPVLDGVPAG